MSQNPRFAVTPSSTMPFQFACPACQRTLSVPSRKAGTTIDCPRCHASIQAPSAAAVDRISVGPADDEVSDGIVLPRRALIAQAILLAVTAGITLLAGFAIGLAVHRGDETPSNPQIGQAAKLSGSVHYTDKTGKQLADEGALVIALPLSYAQTVESPLPAADLAIDDAAGFAASNAGKSILAAGGSFTWASTVGDFALPLRAGNYRLLLVSRHAARRSFDQQALPPLSLDRVFTPAADVVRDRQFRWLIEQVDRKTAPLSVVWER